MQRCTKGKGNQLLQTFGWRLFCLLVEGDVAGQKKKKELLSLSSGFPLSSALAASVHRGDEDEELGSWSGVPLFEL